jgi:hypothetical protein
MEEFLIYTLVAAMAVFVLAFIVFVILDGLPLLRLKLYVRLYRLFPDKPLFRLAKGLNNYLSLPSSNWEREPGYSYRRRLKVAHHIYMGEDGDFYKNNENVGLPRVLRSAVEARMRQLVKQDKRDALAALADIMGGE